MGAWGWEWEEDISFEVSRGIFLGDGNISYLGDEVLKNLPANTGDVGDPGSNPWVRKIAWNRKWQPIPVFLPGKFHEQRSLVGYTSWSRKELDMTEQLNTHTQVFSIFCIYHLTNYCLEYLSSLWVQLYFLKFEKKILLQ